MSSIVKKKVFVGLSGGVDSSVSAALLKNDGYEVTGVFIRVWIGDAERTRRGERGTDAEPPLLFQGGAGGGCQAADDRLDAMRVCAKLGIPFVELNLEKEYKKEVVDYMIREYKAGRTPNPDVFCNRFIKFGAFYDFARKEGADYVATGHYARITKHVTRTMYQQKMLHDTCYMIHAGSDPQKDQSYFLWQLRKEQLPHILFPIGGMKKPEVRKLAKRFELITADKKDSQGLCFVGKVDMKEFLSHYIATKKGRILDGSGKVIGEHDGMMFYTIGERLGFAASFSPFKRGDRGGWFVVAKDMRKNTLTVSHKAPSGELPLARKEVVIKDCNWVSGGLIVGKTYSARVRYRQPLQSCKLKVESCKVLFKKPQIAAAGQSLVLYDGDLCLGGGILA